MNIAFCKSPLPTMKGSYARVVESKLVPAETLFAYMTDTSALKLSTVHAVFEELVKAFLHYLPSGDGVETPLGVFTLRPYFPQPGEGEADSLAPRRSVDKTQMSIGFRPKAGILEEVRQACSVQVVDTPALKLPVVQAASNLEGAASLETAKPGHLIALAGTRLSFDLKDDQTGVFLTSGDGGAGVRAAVYGRIGTNTVVFKLPELAPGAYGLEVRTKPNQKNLRVGAYEGTLTVVA